MKSLILVSALLTIASTGGGAQEKAKQVKSPEPPPAPVQSTPASTVAIPMDLQNKYLKASLRFTNEKTALEETPLYKDLQSTGNALNEAVTELRKACGDKYDLNISQDQTPICVEKPKAPVKPAEKK